MAFIPFGYYKAPAAGGAAFDPTLGGTLTPYFWYDFSDSSTMTFSSANNIEAIVSKGSNTGEIRAFTNAAFTAPTHNGDSSRFFGNNGSGLTSKLARRYSTDGTDGGLDAVWLSDFTIIQIVNMASFGSSGLTYLPGVSYKAYNLTNSPEEFNPLFTGTFSSSNQFVSTDTTSTYQNLTSHYLSTGGNRTTKYSFDGATPTGWQSWFTKANLTTGGNEVGRDTSSTATNSTAFRLRTASNNENFAIGGRARNDVTYAPNTFDIAQVVVYPSLLSNTNIDAVLANFSTAYPTFNLNSVSN